MHIAIGYAFQAQTTAVYFERAFRTLGHLVTYVGTPGQIHIGYDNRTALNDILGSLTPAPDVYVWIDSSGRYFPPGIEELPIPTVCYLIDVHLGQWRYKVARFFDTVFIAQKDYVERYRQVLKHNQVQWLPLAAEPPIRYPIGLSPFYDVAFVGNISRAHRRTARVRRLQLLAKHFRMNDFTHSYSPEEISRIYGQARIVFNTSLHGDVNMRIFEGTASGALLLTDCTSNGLEELFKPGQEIIIYNDDHDLIDKVEYFLAHDKEREQIAAAGRERTLRQHTYISRAEQMLGVLKPDLLEQLAMMRYASPDERLEARLEIYTHLFMLDAIADTTRTAGYNHIHRAWAILPCLARQILL